MRNKNKKGYTIIELLVVMTIIVLLILVGALRQRDTIRRKQVEAQAIKVKQAIELTRDYALTGETISGGIVPEYFYLIMRSNGTYQINASVGSTTYSNINDKAGTITEDASGDATRVRIDPVAGKTIRYSVPHGELNSNNTIVFCNRDDCSNPSMRYTITITQNSVQIDNLQ